MNNLNHKKMAAEILQMVITYDISPAEFCMILINILKSTAKCARDEEKMLQNFADELLKESQS
jgi:hypothetical protein